jgi:hypothetical protein
MKRTKLFLERWGLHAFLLPIFFVIHSYQQYYGLVSKTVAIKSYLTILLGTVVLFILIQALTKHVNRSLQLVTLYSLIFLFFGVVKDFLELSIHIPIITRYSIFLPIIIVIAILFTRLILRKTNFGKINLFQNTLLLILIVFDCISLSTPASSSLFHKNSLVKQTSFHFNSSTNCERPDVYYLVYDCYPGTQFLKDYMQFDNSGFDLELKQNEFCVIKKPKSNYNRTAFSIASTLNFQYLQDIQDHLTPNSKNYSQALLTIRQSDVLKIFKFFDYKFYNLSIFDFENNPAVYKENFLTLAPERILMYNSLIERVTQDLSWNFNSPAFQRNKQVLNEYQLKKRDFNNLVIDSLLKLSFLQGTKPKFVYAHFYLPHPPFFYDANGNSNNIQLVTDETSFRNKNLFLSYLKYTNHKILQICNTIKKGSNNKALILLQSDHGFTDFEGGPAGPETFFKNYIALFSPDKDYSALYDTISNINTFPIIFNKYFGANIPLQKDSSIFLVN